MKINTLFFDIGGVCLTDGWEYESRQRAASHFFLNFKKLNQRHQCLYEKFERGGITLHNYLSQVVFYKKRNFSEAAFIRFMQGESKAYLTTLNLLKKLKQNDRYLLAVINNESTELNSFRIKKFKLQKYFTHFFSSCSLGVRKPKSRIYEIALQVTQRNPQESLFIDDREENIKKARKFNIHTIHLKNVKKLSAELKAYGIRY